ncbi:Six-bladed beta-propeller, TolB-like,WD40-repeat-containing domain,WD40 repeat, conserved site,WD40/YVTN [Cinara cedri]|uniref:Six-bladed beta-propeller, TolB-like,WD40-repeat-containing domain,WD40 repeat, conserved site,WD40/YVTN n=1 Tax=Cinara cedri TaxID=506608 RepID=A0A5E4NKZ6_9HEMI|nr:Six-bladed beta-propeller, TolB-like,WD40-repeat-containing domain,WD40 repeat, conserved site,WD40/YVTN [Cinara cedri]
MGNYCSSKQKDGGIADEYLRKTRYKKNERKADKATNVIAVAKKGKHRDVAAIVDSTAVGTSTPIINNKTYNNNCRGTSNFIIPTIEETLVPSTDNGPLNEPLEPNNVSSSSTVASVNSAPEKCFTFTLPDGLKSISAETKQLILGVFEPTANLKTNKIVIYICVPNNKGFLNERRCLYENVLSTVRSKCAQICYELHIVDLYYDHQFQQECRLSDKAVRLAELQRQDQIGYVVPVVFVDDSLGPPVLPQVMTRQDYDLARSKTPEAGKLIEKWYMLDSQKNHYELRNEMMFETQESDEKHWHDEKVQLQLALMKVSDSKSLQSIYAEQIFVQEIYNEIVLHVELAKRSIWIMKNYEENSEKKCKNTAAESKKRLEQLSKHLKNELPETNIIFFEKNDDANECTKKIGSIITSMIESVEKEREKQEPTYGVDTVLLEELRLQSWFAHNTAKQSVRRDEAMERAKKYMVNGCARYPLILHGCPGSGKTTVMAALEKQCRLWNQDALVVARFADVSAYSSSLEQTLNSLAAQLDLVDTGKSTWFKHDVKSYSEQIKRMLSSIGAKRSVTLLVDGIDRFKNEDVSWISQFLNNNVKVIVSVTEPSIHFNKLRQNIKSADSYIRISNMTDEQINSMLVSSIVRSIAGETINNDGSAKTPFELHVRALFSKIRNLKQSPPPQPQSPENWIESIFDCVEMILGKDKVSIAINYMCATQFGLLDSEAVELLSSEKEFHSPDQIGTMTSSASIFWATINELLSSFLFWFKTDRYATVRWKNAAVAEAASQRYCTTSAQRFKTKILSYHEDQVITASNHTKRSLPKRRQMDECVHLHTDRAKVVKEHFGNLDWLLDKLNNGSVLQLLDELSAYEQDPEAVFLKDFLKAATPALVNNGNQLYSQMSLYPPTAERYRVLIDAPPFQTLIPLVPQVPPAEVAVPVEAPWKFDVVKRLNDDSNYVITVSTERKEISVWNVKTCTRVRTLRGIVHPTALKLIDNQRCIVLCERKLTVINLATGKVISKLKGVMNQNMPYFGLHSPTKLVALARSRMHVNLIDIETGTIEAYFKAGEDRFLNSLLVSGNGRVMVCGDETQKPFPLLVWNLTSRQLMYDLRIPFHEFVTQYSAITYEGHYVCCVAQEVDEPGPNFIVVYDLQSGTLFKKWKPGVNCVALDISSKDGCVLSGHENGQICIWDLTTGNCRWTLGGHVAPVTSLRLDPGGGSFVSLDTHTRDRTIKLWNVDTGQLISEFTPANPITAFEILPGGQYVVVASSDSTHPTILHLRGGPACRLTATSPDSAQTTTATTGPYGDEITALVVDLSEDFRDDVSAGPR